MRKFVIVAFAIVLAGCNQQQQPAGEAPTNPLNISTLVGWTDVATEDINVPQGVTFAPSDVGGARVMEIAGVRPDAISAQRTGGVSVKMPAAFEDAASTNQILVTVRAYADQDNTQMGLAYSTNDQGNSGWYEFALTRQPADYHFVYNVPAKRAGAGDFLGFRSYGEGRIRVVGYQVAVLPRPPSAEQLRSTQSE